MSSVSTTGAPGATVTVCLVEADPLLREFLRDFLVEAGIQVLAVVGTRRDGEVVITYHRPDVAVIGSRLPDGRGVDLIRSLAPMAPGVALLLHTETATPGDARDALQAGAAGIILKSIRGDSLIEAIRKPRQRPQ